MTLLRALGDVVVSRLRIAGLGIGRVDSATGLWYRAVCSAQLARERTETEREKGRGEGEGVAASQTRLEDATLCCLLMTHNFCIIYGSQ